MNASPKIAGLGDVALTGSIAAAPPQKPLFAGGPPALADGRAHEVCGAAADAFAAFQAGLRGGPLIWILPPPRSGWPAAGLERPDPYGLARFLDPGRLILVETRADEQVFWAMEEALRSAAAPCVIARTPARGPLAAADLTRGRRLQLAAEASGALGLLLLGGAAEESAAPRSSAAETRWRAEPLLSRAVSPNLSPVLQPCEPPPASASFASSSFASSSFASSHPASSPFAGSPPPASVAASISERTVWGRESWERPVWEAPSWEWRLLKNKRGPLGRWRLRLRRAYRPASLNQPFAHDLDSASLPSDAFAASAVQDAAPALALAASSDGGACAAA